MFRRSTHPTHRAFAVICSTLSLALLALALILVTSVRAADAQKRPFPQETTRPSNQVYDNNSYLAGCLDTITVTNANDSGDGSLRQAIADLCPSGTISFADNYSIYLDSTLSFTGTVTIDGSGQSVTVSGDSLNDGSRNVRPFTITSTGVVTLTHLTIVDGTATDGGAINTNGQLMVRESTFARNFATASGGAIFSGGGTLTIEQSTFLANSAGINGGAVWVEGNTTLISNSTFSGNSAANGGGLAMFVATATVTHATFSGNSATTGADIRFIDGSLTLRNSILANSTAGANCYGGLSVNTNNLIEDGTCSPALSGDPLLSALGDYGGETQTFALLPDSLALDSADAGSSLATDQRGVARPQGSGFDIGAYEESFVDVSITRLSPAGGATNLSSVIFRVVFTESLTGVDASDFSVTVVSGNITGAGIPAVSGSDTTWDVTVSTGSGDGVIRLDVASATQAVNEFGLSVGIQPYTSGESYTVDTLPPPAPAITSISTDSGTVPAGITSDPTVAINGTAEADSTVILTRVDSSKNWSVPVDSSGSWSFDYTGTTLPIGRYSFTAIAHDAAGNASPTSATYVVTVRTATHLYVNKAATGANNGTSWTNAFNSLQSALSAAGSGDEIWVAAGRYTPGSLRTSSFILKSGVAVYGGFAGNETILSQRNWATHAATLSGDLNGDDSGFTNNGENSYRVVVGATGAILDGFTISGGNANGQDENSVGSGIYNSASSPTLSNLTFRHNWAGLGGGMFNDHDSNPTLTNAIFSGNKSDRGAGIYNDNGSDPTLTNVAFSANASTIDAGGMYNSYSSPALTDVTFSSNTAQYGGAIYNYHSTPMLTDTTFISNTASIKGGGLFNNASNSTLTNVTFSANSAKAAGGMYNENSSPTLSRVTFSANSAQNYGGGMLNTNSSPILSRVTFSANSAQNYGGGLFNDASSLALTNVTINGNTAKDGGGMINMTSSLTLTNVLISGNIATAYDGGGIDNYKSSMTLTNVTITGNRAAGSGGGIYDNSSASAQLRNSIIWGNYVGSSASNIVNDATSGATVSYSIVEGGYSGTGNLNADPRFVTRVVVTGAATTAGDLRLQSGSPAIDAGSNNLSDPGLAATDLDGNQRIVNSRVDMGAYESQIHLIYLPIVRR
jgi:predicted outer membrane repeat protein